jgi:hypothetical protein
MMEDTILEEYSDTREKYADEWLEVGVPNDEYRKRGHFETFADNMDNGY